MDDKGNIFFLYLLKFLLEINSGTQVPLFFADCPVDCSLTKRRHDVYTRDDNSLQVSKPLKGGNMTHEFKHDYIHLSFIGLQKKILRQVQKSYFYLLIVLIIIKVVST